MNPNYSNNPSLIGDYFSDTSVLVNRSNRLSNINAFSNQEPLKEDIKHTPLNIMTLKPRDSVPDQFISVGTSVSKSCNNIQTPNNERFENPSKAIQDPANIIFDEHFRGGQPSRIVMKDIYAKKIRK